MRESAAAGKCRFRHHGPVETGEFRDMRFKRLQQIRAGWSEQLDESRIRLARPDALVPLAVLGLLTGLLAGAVIVLFRLFVEGIQDGSSPVTGRRTTSPCRIGPACCCPCSRPCCWR